MIVTPAVFPRMGHIKNTAAIAMAVRQQKTRETGELLID
jgi:hypothetical protein